MTGKNTIAGDQLRSIIERMEALNADSKQIAADKGEIMAEAKANGLNPGAIKYCIKIRAMKPHDREESEAMRDLYLHAIGMESEPPLFRFAGLGGIDITARDAVIERMKDFVPAFGLGDIVVTMGGKPVRLTRDKDGTVSATDVLPLAPAPEPKPGKPARKAKEPPPEVDAAGAEDLGRDYARQNRPVIDNPFPFGDPRRARFDRGWREETGNDGMGPDDGEE